MKTPDSECCAPFLKALGENTRWRMVQELLSGPVTVGELSERLKVSQYNISKHLRILRESGIVKAVRSGKHVQARIAPTFLRLVSGNKNQLDLGCCVFRFEKAGRRPRRAGARKKLA